MPTGVKISGVEKVISKYFRGDLDYEQSLEAAVKISLNIVKSNARLLLKEYVYDKPGSSTLDRNLSGALYKRLRSQVHAAGKGLAIGSLNALAPEALWIEQGTEGHTVAAVNAKAMHWMHEGVDAFSKQHHISGIYATHFMTDALEMSRSEIVKTFEMVFGSAELARGPLDLFQIGSGIVHDEDEITGAF